jgi:glucosylceramidase
MLPRKAVFHKQMSESYPIQWISSTERHPWQTETPGAAASSVQPNLRLTGASGQPWRGFGGCFNELGWEALGSLDDSAREAIIADLFAPDGGCRFNLGRVPIGASDYARSWYSLDEHEGDLALEHFSIARDRTGLLPYIKAAQRYCPGIECFASPWSPPPWMKHPAACNYGTLRWERDILEAYALYFLKFVRAYREEGIAIGQVHVQNEPNSDQKFPSCVWTGTKMRDFIRDHLGPLFERENEPCEIWAGTIERDDYNAWANTILSDAQARNYVRGVGYQWAGKGVVQRTRQSWPEMPLSQTENECGDGRNSWAYAHDVFSLLHHYITNGVSAYYYWNMVLAPGGKSTWGWSQNAMITVDPVSKTVTRNPEYYVMSHASHFIRPGAVNLGVAGYWAANALAFRNPDGGVVWLVQNPLEEPRTLALETPGGVRQFELPPRSFHTVICS